MKIGVMDGVLIKRVGFDGYLALETEAGEDPVGNAARNLAFVKRLL